jgi:hypothetical protein
VSLCRHKVANQSLRSETKSTILSPGLKIWAEHRKRKWK